MGFWGLFKKCKVWVFIESVVCVYCMLDTRRQEEDEKLGGSGNGGNKGCIGTMRIWCGWTRGSKWVTHILYYKIGTEDSQITGVNG